MHSNVTGHLPSQCQDVDQRVLRLRAGPQAARDARRHAGHLGRRIRPHDLLTREVDTRKLRPRSPSAVLHHVDGRRRESRAAWSTARPTTSPTTSSRIRCTFATFTRPSFISSASTTSVSRTLSGTRREADRRRESARHSRAFSGRSDMKHLTFGIVGFGVAVVLCVQGTSAQSPSAKDYGRQAVWCSISRASVATTNG